MATMLLIAHGTHGDVLPIIGVGAALAADGHQTTVLTHAPYRRTVLDAGLGFIPIDTEAEYARELDETARLAEGMFGNPDRVAGFYARSRWYHHIRRELHAVVRRHVPGDTAVVARHTSGVSALMAAELSGVPTAWVAPWPAQLLTLPLMEHVLAHTAGTPMNQVRAAVGLRPVHDWAAWLRTPSLQLGLWPEWFDAAGPGAPPGVHLTGFVAHGPAESGDLPPAAANLLAADPPPVLITGGTGKLMHERFYRVAAEGCARAGRAAILVCRHRQLVPDPLPAGVYHFAHLPFREVMPRVSAVVHHGGISTIARALDAGTPQVILAWSLDRPDNAARLHRHGLAAWLPHPEWTPERVAVLLGRVNDQRRRPPVPVDSAGSARRAARLLATLPGGAATRPDATRSDATRPDDTRSDDTGPDGTRHDARAELAARLRALSPDQRRAFDRRLRAARGGQREATT